MELETHHKHLLHQRIQDNPLEVMKKIKEKFKNNAILDNILTRIQAKQNEASELNKNKEKAEEKINEKREDKSNFLKEKKEANRKIKKTLQKRLDDPNKLTSTKTEQLNAYTFSLSQSSSESLIEPLMKLKVFVLKEEEIQTASQKCTDLNQAIQKKDTEVQEVFGKTRLKTTDIQNFGSKGAKAQTFDENFIQKFIESFVEKKRTAVLNNLEERENEQIKLHSRTKKYEELWTEFSKQLGKQEPYLNKKIEDSVKKNLNIEEKRRTVQKLQEILQIIQTNEKPKEQQSSQETKPKHNKIENKDKNKDDDILALLGQNRDSLRYIQASKIRINEFLANNVISTFEELQNISKKLILNLETSFENWEKVYMLPPDIYYTNTPEENFSPILQELLDTLCHSNKDYFYFPLLIKMISQKLKEGAYSYHVFDDSKGEEIIKKSQNTYQQRKRRIINELVEIRRELESEAHYKEQLERLIESCQNSLVYEIANLLKVHKEGTLTEYLKVWRKYFGSLSKDNND